MYISVILKHGKRFGIYPSAFRQGILTVSLIHGNRLRLETTLTYIAIIYF